MEKVGKEGIGRERRRLNKRRRRFGDGGAGGKEREEKKQCHFLKITSEKVIILTYLRVILKAFQLFKIYSANILKVLPFPSK